jgi:RNA polymerase sigma factor (sigma-70 family)
MVEKRDTSHDDAGLRHDGAAMSAPEALAWFIREVLPLEAMLTQFLHHNWRNKSEIPDLRQDVYIRVYEAACKQIPDQAKPFLFTTTRNLLITRIRDKSVVPIEAVADLDALGIATDIPGPDRAVAGRDSLRRLQHAIDRLPPRCREVVVLRKIEGLSVREIAARMGVAEKTVKAHITDGMRTLANVLYAEAPDYRGEP